MQLEQSYDTARVLLRRCFLPLVAWIPDISRIPPRRQAAIAVVVSGVFHLLLLLAFLIGGMITPTRRDLVPQISQKPLEVQLVPMPETPQPDRAQPLRRQLLDAKGMEESGEKPETALFETDKDMVAASEKPASGLLPLPSQEGRNDLPGMDFADQDVRIGVAPDPQPEKVQPPEVAEEKPKTLAPTITPLYTPQPVAKEAITAAQAAKPVDALPDPAKLARSTPPPLKMRDEPAEDTLAMLVATPKPKPVATPAPEPEPAPTNVPAPQPRTSITDRFQENMRKTAVEGNITKRGKNGVAAINTPMGRYNRRLSQQIESLWTLKRQGRIGELGTVRVRVKLRADGTIQSAHVVDDGGSPRHTEICLQVVRDMRPEKMPPEAEPFLEDGIMEITFSFTLF
jgi:outer membrane biosynthesis protein TonB